MIVHRSLLGVSHHLAVLLVLLTLLTACGGGVDKSRLNIGSGDLVIEFPYSLERHLTESMQVLAVLTLDDNKTYNLNVNIAEKYVSGNIDDISKGPHTLAIEYFTVENVGQFSIATEKIRINVGDIEILSSSFDEFVYSDDDKDGVTNIAELQLGTDPLDANSKPAAHGVHASNNYHVDDQIINTSTVIGKSQSANYEIR